MADRVDDFLKYHGDSSVAMDIDIQVEAIQYLTEVMRLDREQRLWLSFLFATTYCMATAWYIFTKIPRYDSGSRAQLEQWWRQNKPKLIFQTDRRWIRSRNEFVQVVMSYRRFVEGNDPVARRQYEAIQSFIQGLTPNQAYEKLVGSSGLFEFGRFAMFLYSELLWHAGLRVYPTLRMRDARSVRNGVVFALGMEDTAYTGRDGREATAGELAILDAAFRDIVSRVQRMPLAHDRHHSVWSIETTLCAYKKWHLGKRYVGFYVERTIDECVRMMKNCPDANWKPLTRFAEKYYPRKLRDILAHGFRPHGFKRDAYHGKGVAK